MGKRKSNAAKKKQAAKAKKTVSSAYGVTVLKGGSIETFRRHGLALDTKNDGKTGARKTKAVTGTIEGGPSLPISSKQGKHLFHDGENVRKRQRGGTCNNEKKEFNRARTSLEERSLVMQGNKNDQIRRKKERQELKKGWGKFARPFGQGLAPATLKLNPKTTQELVDDAANRVAHGMNDIGGKSFFSSPMALGKSSLAAAAGLNWQQEVTNISARPKEPPENNPFAALVGDCGGDAEADSVRPLLQFKPATFLFGSKSSPIVEATLTGETIVPGINDIDPDL